MAGPCGARSGLVPLRLVSVAALALAWLGARPAHAYERQHQIGVGVGLSMLSVGQKPTPSIGGGTTIHYLYGLTDQFNLMAEAGSSLVALGETVDGPSTPRNRPAWVSHAAVGVSYVLDVLRWVPYGGVLLGGYNFFGGTLNKPHFAGGAQVALGLDYLIDRKLSVGIAVRQHFVLTDSDDYPSYTTALIRIGYVWGW